MTQAEIVSQIEANKKKIDDQLVKLHQTRLHIEKMRKEADEKYKAFVERFGE